MSEIVTINEIRKTGHCTAGIRRWFEAQGLDFRDFLNNGIDAERLLATNDALAESVVSKIRARNNG